MKAADVEEMARRVAGAVVEDVGAPADLRRGIMERIVDAIHEAERMERARCLNLVEEQFGILPEMREQLLARIRSGKGLVE